MRFPSILCIISLASLVLCAPVPDDHKPGDHKPGDHKPGDIVFVRNKHVPNQEPASAPNMKYDKDGNQRPGWNPKAKHPGVIVEKNADGTYGVAHMSHNLPEDAFPHQTGISEYHDAMTGNVNMGTPAKMEESKILPSTVGSMTPEQFEQFQKDRAAHAGEREKEKGERPSPEPEHENQ
jgi:hypothetical protein